MLCNMFRLKLGNALITARIIKDDEGEESPSVEELLCLVLQAIEEMKQTVETKGEITMSKIDEIKTAVAEQSAALEEAKQRISEDVEKLQDELQDALVEKPELAEILTGIKQTTDSLNSLDPVVDPLPSGGEVTPPTETPETPPTEGEGTTPDGGGALEEEGGDAGPVAGEGETNS